MSKRQKFLKIAFGLIGVAVLFFGSFYTGGKRCRTNNIDDLEKFCSSLFTESDNEVVKHHTSTNHLPDFVLYIRAYYGRSHIYKSVLIQSMRYFWTFNVPLVIILDKTKKDRVFGEEISKMYPYPEIHYEEPFPAEYYHNDGHSLQQLSMFYADVHVKSTFAGFIDTDTVFATMVTPEQLFTNGKPLIVGQFGIAANEFWSQVSIITARALGKKEVMRCMAYFPVIIKVKHIIEMREYMTKLHKKDFNIVFRDIISGGPFSQFSIMCNYVWYFHRDEYSFRFEATPNGSMLNHSTFSTGRHDLSYYKKNLNKEQRQPVVRSSIHYRYTNNFTEQKVFRTIIRAGLCYSGGFDLCPNVCRSYKREALNAIPFQFEYHDWTWDPRCMDAQNKYLKDLRKMNQTVVRERIILGCHEVGLLKHCVIR